MPTQFDRVIIGAGLYGLYSALYCGKKGESVLVVEQEEAPFLRATYINQARVHQGYHYPRSLSTAMKSAGYFKRFCEDYGFCINGEFQKIYATSKEFSWTGADQFVAFCRAAGIPCEELNPSRFFKNGMCDGAFLTREYTYDAKILCSYLLDEIAKCKNVTIKYNSLVNRIEREGDFYIVHTQNGDSCKTDFLLNATYASTNQISSMIAGELFKIKYELCEMIICEAGEELKDIGFTVMDGPFFSLMPFGKTGLHSLTSVTFTPHKTSYDPLPTFPCQQRSGGYCSPEKLGNCNLCPAKPDSAVDFMSCLAHKYLKDEYTFKYLYSMYSMKPILMSSEIDDSRPTVVRTLTKNPTFVSVLSGKINTVYDLDEVLENGR